MSAPQTTTKRAAHDTLDRRRRQDMEYDLCHVSEHERAAASPGLFELRDAGLIQLRHEGWGFYSVTITPAGRNALKEIK